MPPLQFFKAVNIKSAAAATLTIEFCTAVTGSWACTSYPVFSQNWDLGTAGYYTAGGPLQRVDPTPSSPLSSNAPALSLASGKISVSFTYGASFSESPAEYKNSGSPRKYFYIIHQSSLTVPSAWDDAIYNDEKVLCWGPVKVGKQQPTAGAPADCEPSVKVTTAGGGGGGEGF